MVINAYYFVVKKMNKIFLLCILLFTSMAAFANVTKLTASLDKNPVMESESFVLTLSANDNVNNVPLDFSILEKDFVVGRTSISRQTQVFNFESSQTTTWITTLFPKAVGNFTIPSFTVEGISSEPILVQVVQPNAQIGSPQPLFVTAEIDKKKVYLQQQLLYKSKLYVDVNLQRGSLAAPKLANAEIQQLGEDKKYSEIYEGKRYEVIERNFAIVPQQSGSFTIEGPIFEGEVAQEGGQTFSFFNRIRPVTRIAPSIDIEVLPVPNDYSGHWLPSEFVVLNEEWQPELDEYKIGEPITRTLTLTAVGLVEAQLPDFATEYPASIKSYPDQSETASVEKDGALIAQRVQSVALIPSSSGAITIPELTIPWFNTKTQTTEFAKLPSRVINVAPNAESPVTQAPVAQAPVRESEHTSTELVETPTINPSQNNASGWTLTTSIVLALWVLTMFLWVTTYLLSKRRTPKPVNTKKTDHAQNAVTTQALKQALKTNQSSQITPVLTNWLNDYLGQTNLSLHQCLDLLAHPELTTEISKMFEADYGVSNQTWSSNQLLNLIQELQSKKTTPTNKNNSVELKPLYPQ